MKVMLQKYSTSPLVGFLSGPDWIEGALMGFRVASFCAFASLAVPATAQFTEWTSTAGRGEILVEVDALAVTADREGADRASELGIGSTFVSTGLAKNWDVQLGVEFFLTHKYETAGASERSSGFGDVYVRSKWRFYEDDARGLAVALLPYVKLPTNSGGVGNRSLEGGVVAPWEIRLAPDLTLNAMADVSFFRNEDDHGYEAYYFVSATMARTLTNTLSLYGEAGAGRASDHAAWETMFGAGLTWQATDSFAWDLAVYRGLSRSAADWHYALRFVTSY